MKSRLLIVGAALFLAASAWAQDDAAEPVKIKPKARAEAALAGDSLLAAQTDVIDTPTAAVLDYMGYASRTRFFSRGGIIQYVNFGIFQRLNLGASLNIDGVIGSDRDVRLRAPDVQVKYRFFDGDRYIPAFAVGYDGQGWVYNVPGKRYNERQRGFFVVGSQELGVPGLMGHPSFNISDFDTNNIFAALPLTYNLRDKVEFLAEWDNAFNTISNSRLNAGLRAFVTPNFSIDFAVRRIGRGGLYSDGQERGEERIVQLKYSGNF
jgi:hypothetical protein